MSFASVLAGDPAPQIIQPTLASDRFRLDTVGGRYIVLCFFGSMQLAPSAAAMETALKRRDFFNDVTGMFFGVTCDPGDVAERRVAERYPGYRIFIDADLSASRLYGIVDAAAEPGTSLKMRPGWFVLDPTLRVIASIPFEPDGADREKLLRVIDGLPPPERFAGFKVHAPILVLPQVFEPALCSRLIGLYEAHGGEESGFMREVNGKTVGAYDRSHKSRRDYLIEDPELIRVVQSRIVRRVVPEIRKVHQFTVTRMERYLVGCYAADEQAHFAAHRDNTTKGTAHRRFAVSINLNSDFEGGEVSFPEYGPESYKAPVGGAVVFSCSLLHAVSLVTRGRRFAFLPFLYDDEAARIREENNAFVTNGAGNYVAGSQPQ